MGRTQRRGAVLELLDLNVVHPLDIDKAGLFPVLLQGIHRFRDLLPGFFELLLQPF